MRLVYELCPSPGGADWMCQHKRGCGDRPFMLSEQSVNISVPVKLLAKSSASLWVLFSEPQTSGARPPQAEQHLKICEGDLKGSDAAWCGYSLLGWQQSGGPVHPERHDNYRAKTGLRKTACRRNTPSCYWTEITGLTWDVPTLGETETPNSKPPWG